MDSQTYEQLEVDGEIIGDGSIWLCEGDECEVITWNSKIIQVEPPKFVNIKVVSTELAVKGDTVSTTLKDARLENGVVIKVPAFIKEGESIRIDTKNSEYVSRVKN